MNRSRRRFSIIVFSCWLTTYCANLLAQSDPSLTVEPTNQTAIAGSDVTFVALGLGTPPLAYQWQFEGSGLFGATESSLFLTNVQPTQAGAYRVVVTNVSGQVISSNATLTIIGPYTVSTLAGLAGKSGTNNGSGVEARFYTPAGIAVDPGGTLFVSEYGNHTIRKITPFGTVTTLAGVAGSIGTNDGPGISARFHSPEGVALDSSTNLYVADNLNHTIRKITPDGTVSTLAGLGGSRGFVNGTGSVARFYQPNGIVLDQSGNLYVSEWGNGGSGDVRKITPGGAVTTVATGLFTATGIARDAAGNFYVSEQGNNRIRKITMPAATVSSWRIISTPYGGILDSGGNFYLAGCCDNTIRVAPAPGGVAVLAGVSGSPGSDDGQGASARFYSHRSGIATDSFGNLYVADYANHTIRKAVPFAIPEIPRSQAVPLGTTVSLSVSPAASGPREFT